MAWCPKCKNEYRKGITVCAECGCALVEEDPNKKIVPIMYGAVEMLKEVKRFLEYNHIKSANIFFNEKENMYIIGVSEDDKEQAMKYAKVFTEQRMQEELQRRQVEAMKEMMASGNVPGASAQQTENAEDDENSQRVEVPTGAYLNSAQKAEDNRSSAWTLLLVGGIGMVVMILGILDLLPFQVGNPYMFYGVMSAVFILFIVMGFVSMKNAKFFAKNAESENNLKNTVLDWCRENIKADEIDAKIQYADQLEEEVLYLQRYQIMKYMINHQFMNLDQTLVERMIDDEVYDMVFPPEEA